MFVLGFLAMRLPKLRVMYINYIEMYNKYIYIIHLQIIDTNGSHFELQSTDRIDHTDLGCLEGSG